MKQKKQLYFNTQLIKLKPTETFSSTKMPDVNDYMNYKQDSITSKQQNNLQTITTDKQQNRSTQQQKEAPQSSSQRNRNKNQSNTHQYGSISIQSKQQDQNQTIRHQQQNNKQPQINSDLIYDLSDKSEKSQQKNHSTINSQNQQFEEINNDFTYFSNNVRINIKQQKQQQKDIHENSNPYVNIVQNQSQLDSVMNMEVGAYDFNNNQESILERCKMNGTQEHFYKNDLLNMKENSNNSNIRPQSVARNQGVVRHDYISDMPTETVIFQSNSVESFNPSSPYKDNFTSNSFENPLLNHTITLYDRYESLLNTRQQSRNMSSLRNQQQTNTNYFSLTQNHIQQPLPLIESSNQKQSYRKKKLPLDYLGINEVIGEVRGVSRLGLRRIENNRSNNQHKLYSLISSNQTALSQRPATTFKTSERSRLKAKLTTYKNNQEISSKSSSPFRSNLNSEQTENASIEKTLYQNLNNQYPKLKLKPNFNYLTSGHELQAKKEAVKQVKNLIKIDQKSQGFDEQIDLLQKYLGKDKNLTTATQRNKFNQLDQDNSQKQIHTYYLESPKQQLNPLKLRTESTLRAQQRQNDVLNQTMIGQTLRARLQERLLLRQSQIPYKQQNVSQAMNKSQNLVKNTQRISNLASTETNDHKKLSKMRNLATSMSKNIQDIKYQDYLEQVSDLNKVKDYFKKNYQNMNEDTRKVMGEHIISRQRELEEISFQDPESQ